MSQLNVNSVNGDTSFAIEVGAAEMARIDSSGYVGIRTTTPSEPLEVARLTTDTWVMPAMPSTATIVSTPGNNNAASGSDVCIMSGNTASSTVFFGDSDNAFVAYIEYDHSVDEMIFRSSNAEAMRIDGSGNVGIRTTSPSKTLEVARLTDDTWVPPTMPSFSTIVTTPGNNNAGSGSAVCIMSGNTGDSLVYFGDSDDADVGYIQYDHTNEQMLFFVGAAERMRTDSNGQLNLGNTTSNTAVANSLVTSGRIQSDASYTLTTASAANVHVATTGLFSRSTSSIKYKTEVEDADYEFSESIVFNSRPVWYRSLSEGDPSGNSYWGFIAEEVAEIDPRMVHWGADGQPEGVQYERYVVHLVNVIKKQQQQIDALEQRLTNAGI